LAQKVPPDEFLYTLYALPSHTDPTWILAQLKGIKEAEILIRLDGLDQRKTKKMAERARRRSQETGNADLDAAVSFEESSQVLEGLIRGTEQVIRLSFVIRSPTALDLDPAYFCREKNTALALASIGGRRVRPHRPHYVRLKTASDLTPTLLDQNQRKSSLLQTRRGFPLYFSPLDERLPALHWLVVGATGAGKSFFTGLLLKRLLDRKENASVLFIDHNRSFKRLCQAHGLFYLEPNSIDELTAFPFEVFDCPRVFGGIELSDLLLAEKKEAARFLLDGIEKFLRERNSSHVLYVVLDECWNFLRDEPIRVQRAYREYRKLKGAVVSLSQSLTDFLLTENGQSILQNAPIRILLRQGEDLLPLRSVLELNDVELRELRQLKQKRGVFSEALIKTPYSSEIGRLYPTEEEFELLQTETLRQAR
jgi:hypothetical protein